MMSPARRRRDQVAALSAAALGRTPEFIGFDPASGFNADQLGGLTAAEVDGHVMMRLATDLRRLKDIQSIERKIEAKRQMLPEYAVYVDTLLSAAAQGGNGFGGEVLPTIMIWRIDTGDYEGALRLAEYVLAHDVPLPSRYERTAACLIVEEIADGVMLELRNGKPAPVDLLRRLEALTDGEDMPDEVRAKLYKAIGLATLAQAHDADAPLPLNLAGLAALNRALALNANVGVKKQIEAVERTLRDDAKAAGFESVAAMVAAAEARAAEQDTGA